MLRKMFVFIAVYVVVGFLASCASNNVMAEPYGSTVPTPYGEMVLYDQFNIPSTYGGRQISKSYYYKNSVKKLISDKQNLLVVKTYRKVTDEGGATEYRTTFHINCETQECTIVRHWSTGFGEDKGLMVDGNWIPISRFDDMVRLADAVCSNE